MKKNIYIPPQTLILVRDYNYFPLCYSYDENNFTEYWDTENYDEL